MKTVSVPNPDGSVTVKKVVECLDDEPATQTVTVCDADKNICTEKELPAQVDIDASLPRGCEKKIISSQHPDGTFSEKEVVVCEGDETGPPPETQNVVVCDLDEGVCEEKALPGHIDIEGTMPDECELAGVAVTNPDGTVSYDEFVACKDEQH